MSVLITLYVLLDLALNVFFSEKKCESIILKLRNITEVFFSQTLGFSKIGKFLWFLSKFFDICNLLQVFFCSE